MRRWSGRPSAAARRDGTFTPSREAGEPTGIVAATASANWLCAVPADVSFAVGEGPTAHHLARALLRPTEKQKG